MSTGRSVAASRIGDLQELDHARRSEDRVLAVIEHRARPEVLIFVFVLGVGRAVDGDLHEVGDALEQRDLVDGLNAARRGSRHADPIREGGCGTCRRPRLPSWRTAPAGTRSRIRSRRRRACRAWCPGGWRPSDARAGRSSGRRRASSRRRSGAWRCRSRRVDRAGSATVSRVACGIVRRCAFDPAFVVAVADGAAGGERAVEVDAAARQVAAQAEAQSALDASRTMSGSTAPRGQARTALASAASASRCLPEPGERAGLGAQERGANRLVLAPDELGVGLVRRC